MTVVLHSPISRVVAACLASMSSGSLIAIAALLMLGGQPVNPLRLLRWITAFSLLPTLALALLRWTLRAELSVAQSTVSIQQRHRSLDIALDAIASVRPWMLPAPGYGLTLRSGDGERLVGGIETSDPDRLLSELRSAGAPGSVDSASSHPFTRHIRARCAYGARRGWVAWLLRFPAFALVPTLPLFRVHQLIAYGGVLGEYYQYGLGAYLSGFAIYWATLSVYLVVYAACLRACVEVIALAVALGAPARAAGARRIVEQTRNALYYGGVVVMLVLRFLPW